MKGSTFLSSMGISFRSPNVPCVLVSEISCVSSGNSYSKAEEIRSSSSTEGSRKSSGFSCS